MKSSSTHSREIKPFKTAKAFETWLSKNHTKQEGIWIQYFKKDSGVKTITYAEALQIALCYGWIDGQADKCDEQSWLQKWTPRRSKSIWSKRNVGYAEKLIEEGKMQPPGLVEVERAKGDGRWEAAYDEQKNMVIPEDFLKLLSKDKKALEFFETLNKTNRFSIGFRLQTAKKAETREKRMEQILQMMKEGKKFH